MFVTSGRAARRTAMMVAARAFVFAFFLVTGCAGLRERPAPSRAEPGEVDYAALVASPDRTDADRETDARRHPAALLAFIGVRHDDRVADLGAGAGHTTELLARAVGPRGIVYAQNSAYALEHFVGESWPARLARPVNANVVRVDQEFADPLPPEAIALDRVTILFSYHDVVVQGGDRHAMNAAVFRSLRPGGVYIVADHRAREGSGLADTERLHRIDAALVRAEIEAAGFDFDAESDLLHDPTDTYDFRVWTRGFRTDRFLMRFRKPAP